MYTCLRSITTVRTAIGQGYRWRNIDARKRVHARGPASQGASRREERFELAIMRVRIIRWSARSRRWFEQVATETTVVARSRSR